MFPAVCKDSLDNNPPNPPSVVELSLLTSPPILLTSKAEPSALYSFPPST